MCTKPITDFHQSYQFLSNFWLTWMIFEDLPYPTVEHAFQAAKTMDKAQRLHIASALYPREAKRRGQSKTLKFREDWEDVKIETMLILLRLKFTKNLNLRILLLNTGDAELIEGNTWNDFFWGVCDGEGLNVLGILLMLVREELKNA